MRRYNIVSRILLILTVITFTLAAPVLVQEKRQAWLDVVHVPEDVITVLGKRILDEDLDVLWDGWWHYGNVMLPQGPADSDREWTDSTESDSDSDDDSEQPLWDDWWHYRNVMLPQGPADSDREWTDSTESDSDTDDDFEQSHPSTVLTNSDGVSMELDDNAPPGSPESGHSHSPATSSESSTESEDWYTAPSSLGSDSDSDSDRWSTISNAPSADSLSKNLEDVNYELKGKAKVERRISGSTVPPVVLTR
jgi:hypothetical protein